MIIINVIVCVDNNNGMMFNQRRQSMDKLLRKRVYDMAKDTAIWMNEYTKSQFIDDELFLCRVDEDFIHKAGKKEYCFVENPDILKDIQFKKIIVYRWNRSYPADKYLDIDLTKLELINKIEFTGNSHEKITEEVYENEKY